MNVPVFVTIIGSHMWEMSHDNSDADLFVAYAESTKRILAGENTDSKEVKFPKVDIVVHEIGKVVFQLAKGNYNYVTGLMSPKVVVSSTLHEELKEVFLYNLENSPGIVFTSIYGLANDNYKKYIATGQDASPDRIRKIARGLFYGINVMENPLEADLFNIFKMTTYQSNKEIKGCLDPLTRASIVKLMEIFKARYDALEPEKKALDPQNLKDWLVQTRKNILIAGDEKDVWRKLRA